MKLDLVLHSFHNLFNRIASYLMRQSIENRYLKCTQRNLVLQPVFKRVSLGNNLSAMVEKVMLGGWKESSGLPVLECLKPTQVAGCSQSSFMGRRG